MSMRQLPLVALTILALLLVAPTTPAPGSLQRLLNLADGRSTTGATEPSTVLPEAMAHAVAVVPAGRADATRLLAVARSASLMTSGGHQSVVAVASTRPLPWPLVAGPVPRAPPAW